MKNDTMCNFVKYPISWLPKLRDALILRKDLSPACP